MSGHLANTAERIRELELAQRRLGALETAWAESRLQAHRGTLYVLRVGDSFWNEAKPQDSFSAAADFLLEQEGGSHTGESQ